MEISEIIKQEVDKLFLDTGLSRERLKEKSVAEYLIEIKGGSGSGNFGHAGRPGAIGGSSGDIGVQLLLPGHKRPVTESINSKLKKQIEGIMDTDHAVAVKRAFAEKIEDFAFNHTFPKEIIEDQIKEIELGMKERLKSVKVCKRVNTDDLESILYDQRIKSQFETGDSDGSYIPAYRSKMETHVLNNKEFHPESNKSVATIYGYLSKDPSNDADAWVQGYGENTIVFKDSIRKRTTFTDGDSLGNAYGDSLSVPSPINKPSVYSLGRLKHFNPKTEPKEYIKDESYDIGGDSTSYYEAQIHGKVRTSDIAKIYMGKMPFGIMLEVLDTSGIEWGVKRRV